ncbi:MAG: hypothetical protein CL610_18930 [Anaerolineaceae bacterium]|nr:hypothetical protein [Anaerolineaceae bacterium]
MPKTTLRHTLSDLLVIALSILGAAILFIPQVGMAYTVVMAVVLLVLPVAALCYHLLARFLR